MDKVEITPRALRDLRGETQQGIGEALGEWAPLAGPPPFCGAVRPLRPKPGTHGPACTVVCFEVSQWTMTNG